MEDQIYIHTCFIRLDFGNYSRYSESFKLASFNNTVPKPKPAVIIVSINTFIKKSTEAQEFFKKYGLSGWTLEVEKTEKAEKLQGQKFNFLFIDEVGQDFEPEKKLVKRI